MKHFAKYQEAHTEFLRLEREILNDIPQSTYPNSLKCIYYKIKSIELLKDSIINSKNIYSVLVIYRSLIEHAMVGFYVFQRIRIEESDQAGEDYYDVYSNSEFFKQENYSIRLEQIKDDLPLTNGIESLVQRYPDLKELSQADFEEYHKIGNMFSDIKKIGIFLIKNKNHEPHIKSLSEQIFKLLEKYNFLSSYVHGGPYAERETFYPEEDNNEASDKLVIEEWALMLSTLMKTILVLILRTDFSDKYANSFSIMWRSAFKS